MRENLNNHTLKCDELRDAGQVFIQFLYQRVLKHLTVVYYMGIIEKEDGMIIDIALTCVGIYIGLAGIFLMLRRDAVWNYQQRSGRGLQSASGLRTPEWDQRLMAIGTLGLLLGMGLLALVWIL